MGLSSELLNKYFYVLRPRELLPKKKRKKNKKQKNFERNKTKKEDTGTEK